jgi:GATA-binding protein
VGAASTRSSKKASRKNSLAQTPVTTPTSGKASGGDSESPKSATGSVTGGTTVSNAANNVSGGIAGGKSGVIPIAPGPPKPQAAPSANSAPNRGVNVAPKRLRRQSKAGMQELEMVDADDTSGKAPALPTARKKDPPLVPTNLSNQNLGSLPMGAMGQGLVTGVSGPQEWEWLTMSL